MKLLINTAERAATPDHDIGVWIYECPEGREAEVLAAFETLGFKPEEVPEEG